MVETLVIKSKCIGEASVVIDDCRHILGCVSKKHTADSWEFHGDFNCFNTLSKNKQQVP